MVKQSTELVAGFDVREVGGKAGVKEGGEAGGLLPGLLEAQALVLVDDKGFIAPSRFIEGPEALRGVLEDAAGLAIVRLRLELIGLACGGELGQGLRAA